MRDGIGVQAAPGLRTGRIRQDDAVDGVGSSRAGIWADPVRVASVGSRGQHAGTLLDVFHHALQVAVPELGETALGMLEASEQPPIENVLTVLLNAIAAHDLP